MVYLGLESDYWWLERVLRWQLDVDLKVATLPIVSGNMGHNQGI